MQSQYEIDTENAGLPLLPAHVSMANRSFDSKGRIVPQEMTDRELLEEICLNQRTASDLIEKFINDMSSNPMLRTMAKLKGKSNSAETQ